MREEKEPPRFLLTIAICTRDRADLLHECLTRLYGQAAKLEQIQVLIVDNGSTDDTARVVKKFSNGSPRWTYLVESKKGLSHARNAALTAANSDWLAFLDDDARPLPGYVARLRQLVQEGDFDCVGGVYFPWYRDGRKVWFRDSYASNADVISEFGDLPEGRYASGGNILLRTRTVVDVGGFRTDLGMAGRRLGYGEEVRLQVELRKRGYRISADPTLQVEHLTALRKQSLGGMFRSAWAIGRDRWTTFDDQPTLSVLIGVARRIFTRPLVAVYGELFKESEPTYWQSLVLAMGRPIIGTVAELLAGIRLSLLGRP